MDVRARNSRPGGAEDAADALPTAPERAAASRDAEDARSESGLLQRGFAILEALLREERPLSAGEIADLVGLNTSTTHRLLQTLTQVGYLNRDGAKRYHPTARSLFPISLYHPLNLLRRVTSEELRILRHKFGLTVALLVCLGSKRIVLDVLQGNDSFSPYFQTEVTAPIHATASGKLLLSSLSGEERTQVLGEGPYEAHTSRTLVARADLDEELARTAERGYSLAIDEMLLGLSGIGSPIWFAPRRLLGGVVISGPTKYFDAASVARMAETLKGATELFSFASPDMKAVSRFLGY
jgi:DNA-binding IclR family transcriptional regulator